MEQLFYCTLYSISFNTGTCSRIVKSTRQGEFQDTYFLDGVPSPRFKGRGSL